MWFNPQNTYFCIISWFIVFKFHYKMFAYWWFIFLDSLMLLNFISNAIRCFWVSNEYWYMYVWLILCLIWSYFGPHLKFVFVGCLFCSLFLLGRGCLFVFCLIIFLLNSSIQHLFVLKGEIKTILEIYITSVNNLKYSFSSFIYH